MINLIPSFLRIWDDVIYLIPEDKLSVWEGVESEVGSNDEQLRIKKRLKKFKLKHDLYDVKVYVHPSVYEKMAGELAPV